MHKYIPDVRLRARVLTLYTWAVLLLPNCCLAWTEPYSIWSKVFLVLFPAGVYALWLTALKRLGVMVWAAFLFLFFGAFQLVLLYLFGNSIIATDMFTNLWTTNPDEATELLSNIWPSVVLVCVLYLPLLWWATSEIRHKSEIPAASRRRWRIMGAALLALSAAVYLPAKHQCEENSLLRHEVFPVNVMANLKLSLTEMARMRHFEATSGGFSYEARRADSLQNPSEREVYVFMIGEASRAASWQLYGYERETTPRLSELEDLVVFRNMLTQSNTTHKSVPMILSSVATGEHEELYRRKGLPALFREAGFKTWFISNQSPQGAMIDKLAADADTIIYMDNPRYDGRMVELMTRTIAEDPAPKQFYILHCYGSHFSYHQRYPREAAHFLPDDDVAIKRDNAELLRNAYDNSILYTDRVIADAIAGLRALGCRSALLYCADHGEDLLDDRRQRFLHASPTTTFYQLWVASVAWFSADYRRDFPERAAAAERNTMAPATTHALFHTMADIALIESPYIDRGVSLVSDEFDYARPRCYLNDHNKAKPFVKTGLKREDLENFERQGIRL